jgi:hypothetical protein
MLNRGLKKDNGARLTLQRACCGEVLRLCRLMLVLLQSLLRSLLFVFACKETFSILII